jgi:hypothetical protein
MAIFNTITAQLEILEESNFPKIYDKPSTLFSSADIP